MPRGRPRKVQKTEAVAVEDEPEIELENERETSKMSLEDMPLDTLADYKAYNKKVREMNKKLRQSAYAIKRAPLHLHPKQRVVFQRKDQPKNPLPVYLSTDLIEYRNTLIPGKVYDLPVSVLKYLGERGTPVFEWFENADGSKETRQTHIDPRFAFRTVYEEE